MNFEEVRNTSLCMVIQDPDGTTWLKRLADFQGDQLMKFRVDTDQWRYFDNRDKLYRNDGPSDIGAIGIWDWTATPRDTDPDKDYVQTHYCVDILPIEVVEIPGVSKLDGVIQKLRNGIPVGVYNIPTIYCIKQGNFGYRGVLCTPNDLEVSADSKRLSADVVTLPVCELDASETLLTEEHRFIRALHYPVPTKKILVKDRMEIIKDIVIRRSSWSVMKEAGFSKANYKAFKDYIASLPSEDFYSDVAHACYLTRDDAKSCVDDFIVNADVYLEPGDVGSEILEALVDSNESLRERYTELVEQKWLSNNADRIKTENEKLGKLVDQIEVRRKEDQRLADAIAKKKEQLEQLSADVSDREKFADEVSERVEQKIASARENAAEFVASMAFTQPASAQPVPAIVPLSPSAPTYRYSAGKCVSDDLKEIETLSECAEGLADELIESGVEQEHITWLASLMLSAWKNQMPLLLAGPNAADIADALSVSLNGHTADRVICAGNYKPLKYEAEEITHRVVVIQNVFTGDWIDHVSDLISDRKSYFVFTNPFTEDLMIEPRGIYNYMLPIFTERLVDKLPTRMYLGGILSENSALIETATTSRERRLKDLIGSAGGSSYLISRYQSVIVGLKMREHYQPDWDHMTLLSYVVATRTEDGYLKALENDDRLSANDRNTIKSILGIE